MNQQAAYYFAPDGKRHLCLLIATHTELGGVARIKRGEHEEFVAASSVKSKAEVNAEFALAHDKAFAKRKAAAEEFCKANVDGVQWIRRQVRYRMKKYGIKDPRLS